MSAQRSTRSPLSSTKNARLFQILLGGRLGPRIARGGRPALLVALTLAFLHAELSARQWKDATGQFSVEAELVGFDAGVIALKKNDGKRIDIPLTRLSAADQKFVADWNAARSQKPAAAASAPVQGAGLASAGKPAALTAFLESYCIKCHGAEKQKGKIVLHTLRGVPLQDTQIELWKQMLEQLENGEMPPEDEKQPSPEQRKQVQQWIKMALANAGETLNEGKMLDPSKGNWVDHDTLFSGKATATTATPARLWRLTGQAYEEFIQQKNLQFKLDIKDYGEFRIKAPWNFTPQWNFNDYASSHQVGEAEIEYHMRNVTQLAQAMAKKFAGRNQSFGDWIQELNVAIKVGSATTAEQAKEATLASFKSILGREPSAKELDRSSGFLATSLKALPAEKAAEQFLITILFQPEVMYRLEVPSGGARQMLEPRALSRALAFALTDLGPDEALRKAVAEGKLTTREHVREHVARILGDPALGKPRILRFFQEYFGYTSAPSVFKDEVTLKAAGLQKSSSYFWYPLFFVGDADNLIQWVLKADKNVLYELLTTTKTFAATADPKARDKEYETLKRYPDKPFPETAAIALKVYELSITRQEWTDERPFDMPAEHRMGILTHPAWLIAQSGNFDNHAIHRGRWIREKLLGGKIPEVPITVNAMLPDEPHKALRERMRVTREEYCWKCHQNIDPLGMPFEQFDHFGRFRTEEEIVDKEATEKNVDRKGKPAGTKYTTVKLDTTGGVGRSGDPKLDGPVKNPFEMIKKLAASERVQQVFVRHAFRYFIGRNETLEDGPVLVEAHRAYVKNGGSMNALITSLITSDAFLYRAPRAATDAK